MTLRLHRPHDRLRRPGARRRRTAERGFTLIETIVVLTIIAMIAAATVVSLRGIGNNQVASESLRLSGALRMVYGRAAINGLRYQLVIDLEEHSYYVECSEENIVQEDFGEDRSEFGVDEDDEEADPFGLGMQQPTMDDCSEPLIERRQLRHDVRFCRVLTTHHEEPVEDGIATIAFFPNGFVERSMIWLCDKNEEAYYTLSIDPMTGNVRIRGGDIEVPDNFFTIEED